MKYWVYKESRILGPLEGDVVSGMTGSDPGTLVCTGDPDRGEWLPAGEIAELAARLAGTPLSGETDFPSSIGLLDQLQIDAAGLVADDDLPGSLAQELFQDPWQKKNFGEIVSAPEFPQEAAKLRPQDIERALEREALYDRIAELEARLAAPPKQEPEPQAVSIPAESIPDENRVVIVPAPAQPEAAPIVQETAILPTPDWEARVEALQERIAELERERQAQEEERAAEALIPEEDVVVPPESYEADASAVPAPEEKSPLVVPAPPPLEVQVDALRQHVVNLESARAAVPAPAAPPLHLQFDAMQRRIIELEMSTVELHRSLEEKDRELHEKRSVVAAAPMVSSVPPPPEAGMEAAVIEEPPSDVEFDLPEVIVASPIDNDEILKPREPNPPSGVESPNAVLEKRIIELEYAQAELARRLAVKDLELRRHGIAAQEMPLLKPEFHAADDVVEPLPIPILAPPPPAPPTIDVLAALLPEPIPVESSDSIVALAVPQPEPLPEQALPPIVQPWTASLPEPAPKKKISLGPVKTFKVVPTVKSFRIIEPLVDVPTPATFNPPEISLTPAPEPIAPAWAREQEEPLAQTPPAPAMPMPAMIAPPIASDPAFLPPAEPPLTVPPVAAAPVPEEPSVIVADPDLSRFAKPEPAAPVEQSPGQTRSNKPLMIAAGILVVLVVLVGIFFLRQSREDMRQLATLDDGKAPIGTATLDEPIVKPSPAPQAVPIEQPLPEPAPAPAAKIFDQDAAIALVKNFPLDGGRENVGSWLQYSYTASPGAGSENWSASQTGDDLVLVEYRLIPGAKGGKGAVYLFEANTVNGLVTGKNLEARQMLAGGGAPPAAESRNTSSAKKNTKKKAARRVPASRKPVENFRPPMNVNPDPLQSPADPGDLQPPAQDEGAFGSDGSN